MSRAWGPRAHPERCEDEMRYDPDVPGEELVEQERARRQGKWSAHERQRKMTTSEQILTVLLLFGLTMALVVWLTERWGW